MLYEMYTGAPPNKVLLEDTHFDKIDDVDVKNILLYIFSKKLKRKKNPIKVYTCTTVSYSSYISVVIRYKTNVGSMHKRVRSINLLNFYASLWQFEVTASESLTCII